MHGEYLLKGTRFLPGVIKCEKLDYGNGYVSVNTL